MTYRLSSSATGQDSPPCSHESQCHDHCPDRQGVKVVNLEAVEWYTVGGRQGVAVRLPDHLSEPNDLVGQRVVIDSSTWNVVGVEWPCRRSLCGLVVVPAS